MITVNITITPRKGQTIETTWGIEQTRPYPTLTSHYCSLAWQNAEAIFPQYGASEQRPSLGHTYRVALLRSDKPAPADLSSRAAYAGYKPYNDREANPGAFELRGASLGEISATVRADGVPYASWNVRGFSRNEVKPGERDFLNAQVLPALLAAIDANREQLKREAIEALRAYVAQQLTEAREQLDKLEAEMMAGIAKL